MDEDAARYLAINVDQSSRAVEHKMDVPFPQILVEIVEVLEEVVA